MEVEVSLREGNIFTSQQMIGRASGHETINLPCHTPRKYCTTLAGHDLIRIPDTKPFFDQDTMSDLQRLFT